MISIYNSEYKISVLFLVKNCSLFQIFSWHESLFEYFIAARIISILNIGEAKLAKLRQYLELNIKDFEQSCRTGNIKIETKLWFLKQDIRRVCDFRFFDFGS